MGCVKNLGAHFTDLNLASFIAFQTAEIFMQINNEDVRKNSPEQVVNLIRKFGDLVSLKLSQFFHSS